MRLNICANTPYIADASVLAALTPAELYLHHDGPRSAVYAARKLEAGKFVDILYGRWSLSGRIHIF